MSRSKNFAKLDELYDDNRKVKRAWRRNRAAIGLHAMAISYCKRHHTDGLVDVEWIEDRLPQEKERRAVLEVLVETGLFAEHDADSFRVHDFLDWQMSKAERERRARQARSAAQARWGADRNASGMQSACEPHSESDCESHSAAHADRNAEEEEEVEKRTPPTPPRGITPEFSEWITHHQQVTGNEPPKATTKAFAAIVEAFHARLDEGWTLDGLKAATVGAQNDEHRRANGYTTADSVLRPTKVGALATRGKRHLAASDGDFLRSA